MINTVNGHTDSVHLGPACSVQPVDSWVCWYLCLRLRSGWSSGGELVVCSHRNCRKKYDLVSFNETKWTGSELRTRPQTGPSRRVVHSRLRFNHSVTCFILSSACSWVIFSNFFQIKIQHSYCTCRINVTADRSSSLSFCHHQYRNLTEESRCLDSRRGSIWKWAWKPPFTRTTCYWSASELLQGEKYW